MEGKPYAMYGLSCLILSVFPNVKTRRAYHPVKSYHRFEGLQWRQENIQEISFAEIILEAEKFGFVKDPVDDTCLIKFLKETCEGNSYNSRD